MSECGQLCLDFLVHKPSALVRHYSLIRRSVFLKTRAALTSCTLIIVGTPCTFHGSPLKGFVGSFQLDVEALGQCPEKVERSYVH